MPNDLVICKRGPSFPQKAVVSKQVVVGMSGSGKTQTARKMAEAMMDADQHIVVFDPTGGWWGLRSSADGLSEGYPIVVFGGNHGDAPLRPDSGSMLARAILKERFNAIFDMSLFSSSEMRRFTTDILNVVNLHNKHPLHIFFDEFDIVCPQAKSANSEESREAINTTVRRTRIRGIGCMMITQNPQDADKSSLNMADTVIAMRTAGSQAIDAIKLWVGRNGSKEDMLKMTSTLPSLETGHGWIWAPQLGIFQQATFALCKTFDSSKTPELGEKVIAPKVLAKVDIATLGKKIEDQVREERENSTEYLREKIRQLQAQPKSADDTERVMGLMEQVAQIEQERDQFKIASERVPELEQKIEELRERENAFLARIQSVATALDEILKSVDVGMYPAAVITTERVSCAPPYLSPARELIPATKPENTPADDVNQPQQRILNAIATLHASRAGSVSLEWIAATAGTTPRARGFEENMRQLKLKGYVNGIELTASGAAMAQATSTLPTFEAMIQRLAVLLPQPQIAILRRLHMGATDGENLAAAVSTTPRARGFEENIRRLRKSGYIEYGNGQYTLIPWLCKLR